jgi:hypothetical protein
MISNSKRRPALGTIALDVAFGSMLCAALAVATIDFVFLLGGYGANDVACRDAARAAGTSDSQDLSYKAAAMACSTHHTDGYLVSQPVVDQASFAFGDYLNSSNPYVLVTTGCSINLPAPWLASAGDLTDGAFTRRRYAFPALMLIQHPPTVDPIDVNTIITCTNTAVPDTSGQIPGCGSSAAGPGSSE